MLISEFDFSLPKERIAQFPAQKRDESRLMVVHFKSGYIEHRMFQDITHYLNENHVLVLNNSKVIKARLFCKREDTGGKVEFLLTGIIDNKTFIALCKPSRKAKVGTRFICGDDIIEIKAYHSNKRIIELLSSGDILTFIEKNGVIPLPPYIRRPVTKTDEIRYQTVYAKKEGSIAAPTAGLHFTQDILKKLREKGVNILEITLHVGLGTFKPVKTRNIEEHQMDAEYYEIPVEVADKLKQFKQSGKNIVSVGTTSTRTLESWAFDYTKLRGHTDLFIYPGYRFKVVDALLTNFHLPKSTPLLLVSALCGINILKKAYKEAIDHGYRFFSYGDAMLLLND